MDEKSMPPENNEVAGELRGQLVKRLAVAASMVCGLCKPDIKVKPSIVTRAREAANAAILFHDLMVGIVFAAYGVKGGQ